MSDESLPIAGQDESVPEPTEFGDVFVLEVPEAPDPPPEETAATPASTPDREPEIPPVVAYVLGPDEAEDLADEDVAPPAPAPVISIGTDTSSAASNADVISVPKSRWRMPRLGLKGVAALALLGGMLVVGSVGVGYASYDYGRDYSGKIMPGARIAGVDVGGMTRDEALEAVGAAIEPQLRRQISLRWGQRRWRVTPEKLGARTNAAATVEAALAASSDAGFFDRARMRILGHDLNFDRTVALDFPVKSVRAFVQGLASSIDRPVRDASINYDSGWIDVQRELVGRRVRVKKTFGSLMAALEGGASNAPLAVKVKMPKETVRDLDQILLLRIGENKLYLYERGKITRTWTVATGQPSYPTPVGEFEITEKRYMPTWVNPAPTTWGANMPASIPPGIGNPLGLRALNWSAPAIRFHGTSATYSLGYNASHGCVRMSNEDVIELYDLVDVGTPIVSVVVAPLRPLYSDAPDPTPVPEDVGAAPGSVDPEEPARADRETRIAGGAAREEG